MVVAVLSGTVVYDLTDARRDSMRHRVASLPEVPAGARVVVVVGALAPEPDVVTLLAAHEGRLMLDVHGTPRAVRLWLDSLRAGEVLL